MTAPAPGPSPARTGSRRLLHAAALATALWLTACVGDDTDQRTPLPWAEGQPRAYTEAYLAEHPESLARPEHVVAVHLEAVADREQDTGGDRPGVDEIHYHVDRPMTVVVLADPAAARLSHIVLKDALGHEVARHRTVDGPAAAVTAALVPGVYSVELHHAARGDPNAPATTLFLRLADAGQSVVKAAGVGAPEGTADANVLVATASVDCIGCNFDHAALSRANYDGADLSRSTFGGALLDNATLKLATCLHCQFDQTDLRNTRFDGAVLDNSGFVFALLNGASMSYHSAAARRTRCAPCSFFDSFLTNAALFDAVLTGSVFQSNLYNALDNADFSYTDCRHCSFVYRTPPHLNPQIYFQGARLDNARMEGLLLDKGRFDGATLDGATLTMSCNDCSFGANPASGNQPTSLVGTRFVGARIGTANFEQADLTTASFDAASTLMTNGSLRHAKLDSIEPRDLFSAQRFGSTRSDRIDMTGASFAGMDLSHADFASSAVVVTGATDFAGAALSDGIVGIDLSGQDLSSSKALAGLDLRGTNLAGASLYAADLHGVHLGNAVLTGTNLSYANLSGARLTGAQAGVAAGSSGTATRFTAAYMVGVDLTDADLRSADLSLAHLYGGVRFVRTRLDSAMLGNALLPEADLTQASLNDTGFNNALLVNARFGGATLVNTKLVTAYLQGADFGGVAGLQGVTLANSVVSTSAASWSFKEQDGTPYTYGYGATVLGAIANQGNGVTCPNGQTGPCRSAASLVPLLNGPFPPVPSCVPKPPHYDNCLPPKP